MKSLKLIVGSALVVCSFPVLAVTANMGTAVPANNSNSTGVNTPATDSNAPASSDGINNSDTMGGGANGGMPTDTTGISTGSSPATSNGTLSK